MKKISNRLLAVQTLTFIAAENGSLSSRLNGLGQKYPDANLALIREYTYGVCRWYQRLDFIANRLLQKPLRKKDSDVHCLILLGLYQLFHMRTPDHAAINETVGLTRMLKKDWARSLVNAVLRKAQRERETLELDLQADQCAQYSHPAWIIAALQKDWPESFQEILAQNNIQAPMTLRVNTSFGSRSDYIGRLQDAGIDARPGNISETAIILDSPVEVMLLPGFQEGHISVQDEASQFVATLLAPAPGSKVLDACAAPGGKTCAMLERVSGQLDMLALDNNEERLQRVSENLDRLKLQAKITCANAVDTESWWDGQPFDAILLDAPCSATGVIRRHPDIKLLRHAKDISRLNLLQQELLVALWPCLKKGGKLLYSTCSVLRAENEQQVSTFIEVTKDAKAIPISHPLASNCSIGMQFLPGNDNLDGFYYALLEKY